MIKRLLAVTLLFSFANSKNITPNDVFSQAILVEKNIRYLLNPNYETTAQ